MGLRAVAARHREPLLARAPGTVPGMGATMPQTNQVIGASADQNPIPDCESVVSFIDSAVPWTQVRLLFDANYRDHRPTRARAK